MDTTAKLRPSPRLPEATTETPADELLVADDRAGLSPAQMVERKLVRLLNRNPLPVSQINAGRRSLRSR